MEEQVEAINAGTGIGFGVVSVAETVVDNIELTVYPYPINQNARIDLSAFNSAVNVEVYEVLGQLVNSFRINNSIATIDTTELANGNYIVKAFNNEMNLSTKSASSEISIFS